MRAVPRLGLARPFGFGPQPGSVVTSSDRAARLLEIMRRLCARAEGFLDRYLKSGSRDDYDSYGDTLHAAMEVSSAISDALLQSGIKVDSARTFGPCLEVVKYFDGLLHGK